MGKIQISDVTLCSTRIVISFSLEFTELLGKLLGALLVIRGLFFGSFDSLA